MHRDFAPARAHDIGRVECLAAETAGDQRKPAPHHLGIGIRNDRRCGLRFLRHGAHGDQYRLGRRQISMGAFVERAALIGDAAGHPPPKAVGILDLRIVQHAPERLVRIGRLRGEIDDPVPIAGDDRHLAMRNFGDGDAGMAASGTAAVG